MSGARFLQPLSRRKALALVAALVLIGGAAQAGNGPNVVGFGAESVALGGADVAVSRDTAALVLNPAGLTQLGAPQLDTYLVPFYGVQLAHSDSFNRQTDVDNPLGVLAGAGYARQAQRPDLVFGAGLFVAGGTGLVYEDLQTAFGTRDEYSAILGVSKLVGGVGWKASERLSLGASLALAYSQGRQKVFFDTSNADAQFFGLRVDGLEGFSTNARVGLQYRLRPNFVFGFAYATPTEVKLEGGSLSVNYESLGLGRVKYDDARIEGFELAPELSLGFSWQPTPDWFATIEWTWLDWSGSWRDSRLVASRPRSNAEGVPATVDVTQSIALNDQHVFAFGVEHRISPKTVLRIGTNIVRNPLRSQSINPVLNLIAEKEIDFGFAYRLSPQWEIASSLQWQFHNSMRYTSPLFGEAREDYGLFALTLAVSRRW